MKTTLKTFSCNICVLSLCSCGRCNKPIKWAEDFEAELRDIKKKLSPPRDQGEYNVYHFIEGILGDKK